MAERRLLERLSASDLFMLAWDDLGWSGDIGALAILNGRRLLDPDGGIGIKDVRQRLEPRLDLVPRFRQVLYRPRRGLGWPLWVDAPAFDLADHVRAFPLATPADEGQLLLACAELAGRRLDPSRPLWELWLLPGLPQGRVGLFVKLHHVFADGMSGVAAIGALLDLDADAPTPVAAPWAPAPVPTAGELLGDNLRRRHQQLERTLSSLAHPSRTLRRAQATWPVWREFFAEQRAPRTSLNRPIGADRRLAAVGSRLELIKQVAHAHQATVNDVVLAAVAGGLRQLLAGRGEPVDRLTLRAMVPISLHRQPGRAQGNRDSAMVVPLPLGEPDPSRRLQVIAAETAARKHTARPQTGSGMLGSRVVQRAFLRGFDHQRFLNISLTNVPGPPVPLYLAGARLLELFPVVSLMGNFTVAVAVLSYAGQLNLTAVADEDTCPDLAEFTQGVRNTLDELARSVPVLTS